LHAGAGGKVVAGWFCQASRHRLWPMKVGPTIFARLIALRGIGPNVANILQAEILGRRFANRREIAQYAGLAPSPRASGGMQREQGIGKASNPRVRAIMIELAWLWLRHQPGSALSAWSRNRVGQARGVIRRIAIVAVARLLLVTLWRYTTDEVIPKGAVTRREWTKPVTS
jgi:transposase